jgi:hypothetical protein
MLILLSQTILKSHGMYTYVSHVKFKFLLYFISFKTIYFDYQ